MNITVERKCVSAAPVDIAMNSQSTSVGVKAVNLARLYHRILKGTENYVAVQSHYARSM
jgi:hypothetical protein